MKSRTLLILAAVLAALALATVLKTRQPHRVAVGGVKAGDLLFPALDVNAAAAMELREGSNAVRIVLQNGQWVVASLWNHPADYDKLVDNLRTFARLKVAEVMVGGARYLKDFGLEAASNRTPVRISLADAAGRELAALNVGAARMRGQSADYGGYADGAYVRVGSGPVVLVKEALTDWPRQPFAWIKSRLLEIGRDDLTKLSGTVSNQTWTLVGSNGAFRLEGLAANEDFSNETADAIASTLGWLNAAGVADPAKKAAELGLDKPRTLSVTTRSGIHYTLQVGANAPGGCYLHLAADYVQPAAPTNFTAALATATNAASSNVVATLKKEYEAKVAADGKKAQEQNVLFSRFNYIVADDACAKLVPARAALAKLRPPPPAMTNTVGAAGGSTQSATVK